MKKITIAELIRREGKWHGGKPQISEAALRKAIRSLPMPWPYFFNPPGASKTTMPDRVVRISGFDGTGKPVQEELTIKGETPVRSALRYAEGRVTISMMNSYPEAFKTYPPQGKIDLRPGAINYLP